MRRTVVKWQHKWLGNHSGKKKIDQLKQDVSVPPGSALPGCLGGSRDVGLWVSSPLLTDTNHRGVPV